jgi:hypothetical protein
MTMAVQDLIAKCAHLGIHLEPNGDRLRYRAPKGALTPDLIDELKAHKPELLNHFRQHLTPVSG